MPAEQLSLRPLGVIARYIVLGALLGLPVGVTWVLLAPRVLVRSLADTSFLGSSAQAFATTDLVLGLLLAVAGVVIGVVAARRLRRTHFERGWAHVVATIAAALTCAAVARVVGWWLAGRAPQPEDDVVALPITVGANGVLLLGVLTGLVVVALYAGFAADVTPAVEPSEPSSPSADPAG